eukprot:6088850-Amphidinium_carterae.1
MGTSTFRNRMHDLRQSYNDHNNWNNFDHFPVHQDIPHYSDITEEDDEDHYDEYDETRSTTRASASGSNVVHVEKQSLKRKIRGEKRRTPQKKKQGDIITNFYNAKIRSYHAATAREKTKRTSRTADDQYTTTTPTQPT